MRRWNGGKEGAGWNGCEVERERERRRKEGREKVGRR